MGKTKQKQTKKTPKKQNKQQNKQQQHNNNKTLVLKVAIRRTLVHKASLTAVQIPRAFLSRLNVVQKDPMWSLILYVVGLRSVRSMYVVWVCIIS